ncbi:proline dehydrogenase family protein [Micrococcales bacterium 31B]|nr:proline dehydrogenase family protein [Micrococcales bacterium 31B]
MYVLKKPLLALSANHRVRDLMVRSPLTRDVVHRFVPGETTDSVVTAIDTLTHDHLSVTCDHLGEYVRDPADAEATVTAYLDLLRELAARDLAVGAEVSVKLSALGQLLGRDGPTFASENARRILAAAYGQGSRVTLDMEDHTTTDHTLAAAHQLRTDYPDLGVAAQAMLRRTPRDLTDLVGTGSRVRLVKGAYQEPDSVTVGDAAAIDLAYSSCLTQLFEGDGYPMVGSHDPRLIDLALRLAERTGRTPETFEFQMLYGIRPLEQRRLANTHTVRVYVPYGTDWYGYLTRRLAERPANLMFFARSLVGRH